MRATFHSRPVLISVARIAPLRAHQGDHAWWILMAMILVLAGVAASFHIVPQAATALAPQLGVAGAYLILAAIYGLAAAVAMSVVRLAAR